MTSNPLDTLLETLESTWHREIPISGAMDVRVARFADDRLDVIAAFGPNRNLHGTAFAGSLYAVCVLTGWGAVWLALQNAGLPAHIILHTAEIRYVRPVHDDIHCSCELTSAVTDEPIEALRALGKSTVRLEAEVREKGNLCVTFRGAYALRSS
jgi:thioesterase domain-containing protein